VLCSDVVAEDKLVADDRAGCIDESFVALAFDLAEQTGMRMPRSETDARFTIFIQNGSKAHSTA
jgi:hypothetical protein